MIEPLLKSQLEPIARRQRKWRRMRALAICWGAAALLGFLVILCRPVLGEAFQFAMPLLGGASFVATMILWWRTGEWEPDYRNIAREIEHKHPDLHALLLTAVEQQPDPATGRLNFLQERVVAEAVAESRSHQWLDTVSGVRLFSARLAQLTALVLLVFAMVRLQTTPPAPSRKGSAGARSIAVTPGDSAVERGSGVVVLARFTGPVPTEATLVIGATPEASKRIPLARTLADPVFGGSIPEVGSNLVYHVEFGTEQTREFKITVFDYPALQRSDAHIVYPEYTGLQEKRIEETRRVSAVEGSKLDFTFQLNKPVAGARLVGKDKSIVRLAVETNKPLAALKDYSLLTNGTYELQLIDDEGRTNKAHAQFVFEALKNRRPEMKILAPRGDQRVSPLEEVSFSGEAWDDFGLRDYGLTYTVAGHDPVTLALGTNTVANEKRTLNHLLKLEDLHAQPDQLVSWFFWADDIGSDGQLRRTSTDMFFGEVRPFEEIFREAQSQSGESEQQQGAGNETLKLAELQKQIINATWKLQRNETGKEPSAQYKKDAPVVRESQESALEQAEAMRERVTDPRFQPLVEDVIKQMKQAAKHLTKAEISTEPLPQALAAEQTAYQALLKLSAREYQVSRSKNQQAKGGGQQRNQQQLEQLDMKQQEDRYETQRQATPQQNAEQREQLQVLNRLKELAQRQQDMNERIKELQASLQEAKTDEEREEIKRRLKRLREEEQEMLADVDELRQRMERPENQSRMADARQQLEKTRQEVQKTAEALEKEEASQALASGSRAQKDLQKLRDDFRKQNASQFSDEMRQMRNEARQIAEKQEQIAKEMESLGETKQKTLTDSGKSKELADQLQQQRSGLTNLLDSMRGVSEKAEAVEPLLSKQLYETLRKNSQGQTDNSLNLTSELLNRGYNSQASQFEQKARGEINELKQGVEKAAESVLGDDVESLRLARRELDALAQQIEDEMARAEGRQSQTNGGARTSAQAGTQQSQMRTNSVGPASRNGQRQDSQQQAGQGDQSQQGQAGNAQEQQQGQGQGQQGQQQNQQSQQGQGQRGQQGQQGQQGQGQQPQQGQEGQQGQQGKQPGEGQQQGQQGQNQQGQGQGQGQQGQQPGQQPQQGQGQRGQQGQQGEQGQGQQGQQGQGQQGKQPGEGQQQGQQGQNPQGQQGQGQQQGQQGQQQGQGQGQGQGQQQAQQAQQRGQRGQGSGTPGQAQDNPQQNDAQQAQRAQGTSSAGTGGGGETMRVSAPRRFFDRNPAEDGQAGERQAGPLTGDNFSNWSDRLRDVEEMIDVPELRNEVARVRDRARAMRAEYKRHSKNPQWPLVKSEISGPLVEVRNRVAEELARREKSDSLVPIDRDPVPGKYSDLVRRYYEKLGSEEPAR